MGFKKNVTNLKMMTLKVKKIENLELYVHFVLLLHELN